MKNLIRLTNQVFCFRALASLRSPMLLKHKTTRYAGGDQGVIPRKTPFRYDIDVQANMRN
ncbi:hypothetical protein PXH59_03255 [Xenorhabdus sp. SF857]|uniref:hypothetical protein n=1 Tax=Xenorhabdus bakwenae TaxID=3026967 RepID=UPI002557DC8C|nr:hypothetical protein [Xenorhabdus sp. SF857]WFQ80201.1 hypothetical protein PXH59_03255 [Xenorhabdus sp. SF857]